MNETAEIPITLSLVIPAMNEQESLPELHSQIKEVCKNADLGFQIIFVDDGSTDQTWEVMSRIAQADDRVTAIRFRRNFGKAAALSAGFSHATGKFVMTMDADLQDDPTEIPRFLSALENGLDVVSGWKKVRHDPWHKVLPSRVFNAMVSRLTGVRLHDHNCGFKVYRREAIAQLDLYGERHRFIPVLAAAMGWRVGEIEVLHHARQHGSSKYGVSRLLKGFLDLMSIHLLTGYGRRPLHLIGTAGVVCFAAGLLGMTWLSFQWVWTRLPGMSEPLHLHSTAIFYYCILATLLGAQCILAGLIAELVVSQAAARARADRELARQMAASKPSIALSNETTPPWLITRAGDYSISEIVTRSGLLKRSANEDPTIQINGAITGA